MYARTLVEGLFGIVPDALDGELLIRPGLPKDWPSASIDTPNVGYSYTREGLSERFDVRCRLARPMRLRLQVAARTAEVARVTVNGNETAWKCLAEVARPLVEIAVPNAEGAKIEICWAGAGLAKPQSPPVVGAGEALELAGGPAQFREISDPQKCLEKPVINASSVRAEVTGPTGHRTVFVRVQQQHLSWWMPFEFEVRPPLEVCQANLDREKGSIQFAVRNNTASAISAQADTVCGTARQKLPLQIAPRSTSSIVRMPAQGLVPGTNPIVVSLDAGRLVRGALVDWHAREPGIAKSHECIDLSRNFNDRVTEIFKHEYRSPRSPYCSLQIPLHGYGDWCYCGKEVPKIDDAALRAAAGADGRFLTAPGITFATPGPGTAPNVVFTSRWDNFPAEVTIPLEGRARHAWFLVAGSTHPMHSQLDNGEMVVAYGDGSTNRLALHNPTTWWPIEGDYQVATDAFCLPGPHPPRVDLGSGRATILDLPLDPGRPLRSLTIRCLANEVVVGLMSVTIERP